MNHANLNEPKNDNSTLKEYCGLLIGHQRKSRQWSQESLAHGICSVSYLSKIESAQCSPSQEILSMLAEKMGFLLPDFSLLPDRTLPSKTSQTEEALSDAAAQEEMQREKAMVEALFDLLKNARECRMKQKYQEIQAYLSDHPDSRLRFHPDVLLFSLFFCNGSSDSRAADLEDLLCEAMPLLSSDRQALFFLYRKQHEKAMAICPEPWVFLGAASSLYAQNSQTSQVQFMLEQGWQTACNEGMLHVMASAALSLSMVLSNNMETQRAMEWYEKGLRIVEAMREQDLLDDFLYNGGCMELELGHFDRALALFARLKSPNALAVHKIAVCHEQKRDLETVRCILEEAKDAPLDGWSEETVDSLFAPIAWRLDHPDYLHDKEYGRLLDQVFSSLEKENVHQGFAQFHLPWQIQYLKANRQYVRLCALLEDFPFRAPFEPVNPHG